MALRSTSEAIWECSQRDVEQTTLKLHCMDFDYEAGYRRIEECFDQISLHRTKLEENSSEN